MKSDWNRKDLRIEIVEALQQNDGPMAIQDVSIGLGIEESDLKSVLVGMTSRGQIEVEKDKVVLKKLGNFQKKDFNSYFKKD